MARTGGVVMVMGTFDLVHRGHVAFFKQARRYGKKLVVLVARDATVRALKKKSPWFKERERAAFLKELCVVDQVILGGTHNRYHAILKIKPDVICLGHDQTAFVSPLQDYIKCHGLKTKVVRAKPYHREQYQSNKIKKYAMDL